MPFWGTEDGWAIAIAALILVASLHCRLDAETARRAAHPGQHS